MHYYCFSHTEIDDMIRKSTNLLLTRTLGSCLSSLIKRRDLTLLQVRAITSIPVYIFTIKNILKSHVHDTYHTIEYTGTRTCIYIYTGT